MMYDFDYKLFFDLILFFFLIFVIMFTGDDLINLIQTEAINLVDSILTESVSIINNNASFDQENNADDMPSSNDDHQQFQQQLSNDDYNDFDYDQEQQQSHNQQPTQLPLISVNNYTVNPSGSQDQAHSDDISDNFAIKSDCDIIVKSPTIESMSGKSFDDDFIYTSSAFNDSHDINFDGSLVNDYSDNNNTATNIVNPSSSPSILSTTTVQQTVLDNLNNDPIVGSTTKTTVSFSPNTFTVTSIPFDADVESATATGNALIDDEPSLSLSLSDPIDNPAIVRNLSEHKLRRIERKFEHLSSQVRDDDDDNENPNESSNDFDLEQIDNLINKDDISMLQNEFSKISWDESLSATTGDFGSSTPDNDLLDVLTTSGDTN